MELSNLWKKVADKELEEPLLFSHVLPSWYDTVVDDTWRRLVPMVMELRNSALTENYPKSIVDAATVAVSKFVTLIPDSLLAHKRLVDFDIELDNSVEMVFSGRQEVRVNLMLESMDTHEETFVFYQRNGRFTQSNGYMGEVVEILKKIL